MNEELTHRVAWFEKEISDRFKRPFKVIVHDRCSSKGVAAIAAICAHVGDVTVEDLQSKSRKAMVAHIRQAAMYLCRRYTTASLSYIGNYFNRDHTTVRHAITTISDFLEISDSATVQLIETCKNKLHENGF